MSAYAEDRLRQILSDNLPASMWESAVVLARRAAREGLLVKGEPCAHSGGLVERPVCESCGESFP